MPVLLITPRRFEDARGWFAETWHREKFRDLGVDVDFVQDNHSLSRPAGVIRGLHFQTPPDGQAKLVRCLRGRIRDVAVDVRRGSPTYGQWVAAELTAERGEQLFIPVGFAHGFITLEPDTEVAYKVSAPYAPQSDGGIAWDDPAVGVDWRSPVAQPLVSEKDAVLPALKDFDSPFAYDGHPLTPIDGQA